MSSQTTPIVASLERMLRPVLPPNATELVGHDPLSATEPGPGCAEALLRWRLKGEYRLGKYSTDIL